MNFLYKILTGVTVGAALFTGLFLGAGVVQNNFSAEANSIEPTCNNRTVGSTASFNPFPLEFGVPNPVFLPNQTCRDIPLLTHMSEDLGSTLPERSRSLALNGLANVKLYYNNGAEPTNGGGIQNPLANIQVVENTNDNNPNARTYIIKGNLNGSNSNLTSTDSRAGGDLTVTIPNDTRLAYKGRTVRWFPQAIIRKDLQQSTGNTPDDLITDNSVGAVDSNPLFNSFSGYNYPASQGINISYRDTDRNAVRDTNTPNQLDSGYLNYGYILFSLTAVQEARPSAELTKSADKTQTAPGETINYTINYRNTGNVELRNTTITDVLDAKLTFGACTPTDRCSYNNANRTITWNLGTVAPGANASVTFTATVNQGATGNVVNRAFINFEGNPNPIPSNEVIIPIVLGPVAVDDSVNTQVNTPVNIPILNNDFDRSNPSIGKDGLNPSTVTIVRNPANGRVVVNSDGTNTYTPNNGYFGTDTYTYTVRDRDNDLISNIATVTITIPNPGQPGATLVKSADKTSTRPGDNINFTLRYSNSGSTDLQGVVVEDILDPKTTFVSCSNNCVVSDATWIGGQPTKKLTWNIGNLARGASGELSFRVTVNQGATGQVENQGTITFTGNQNPIPSNRVIIPIVQNGPLTIVKTASATNFKPGDTITYTLNYANNSGVEQTNVIITDVLDSKISYVDGSCRPADKCIYDSASRTLTWRLGTLANGVSGSGSFEAKIAANTTGTIPNTARIRSDQNPNPIESTVTVTVDSPSGLSGILVINPKLIFVNEGPVDVRVTDIKYADGRIAADVECKITLTLSDGSTAIITTRSNSQGICAFTIGRTGGITTTPSFPEATGTGNTANLTSVLGIVRGIAVLTDRAGLTATTNQDNYTVINRLTGETNRSGGDMNLVIATLVATVLMLMGLYTYNYTSKQSSSFKPSRSKEGTQIE
jgi:uncharacterized repeat protein (TIGR01451 family)